MIGAERGLPLPMEGALPPDLEGTLLRAGPRAVTGAGGEGLVGPPRDGAGQDALTGVEETALRGMLHAVELREGQAVSYLCRASPADASVFWHAGSVLALPERGIPARYSRLLEPQDFAGTLTVPIASHVHRDASDGSRVLFGVDDGAPGAGPDGDGAPVLSDAGPVWLRLGEWDAAGALRGALAVELERATWQHDIGVTARHVVFVESPTERLADRGDVAVPFGWVPGAEAWLGIVARDGDAGDVRWARLDPCLVTHVLGAYEQGDDVVLFVCAYAVPEQGQPVDRTVPVVGPAGVALTSIGGGLGTLERWRVRGDRVERTQLDDRAVEYPRIDSVCEATSFRYGYCVELAWDEAGPAEDTAPAAGAVVDAGCHPVGLLKFDLHRDEVTAWRPEEGATCTEAVFVRAGDGHGDDEGWLLTVVQDPDRGASDLYVLDASSLGRRRPEAVIHLPAPLPPRSHGEWVPASRYR